MTSPNVVSIVVTAQDKTAPGFKTAEQSASKFGNSLKKVGEIAAGVLTANVLMQGAARLKAFFSQSVEAASALGESVNAVNKTFGESAEQVTDWGEANAAAFGLSTRAFNQMATPLGAMLKNQGLAMDDVADHTLKLTQRAADMASVFNTDVTAALTAIQAGLRGEADPLERYGVSLSAVAVEAQALAETHKTAASQLTAAEKATARLNLIYKQTASTANDFRDTSDGLANSQRIAAAEIENAKAKLGEFFLPVMAKAAQVSGEFATAMTSIPGPLLTVVAAAGALGVGMLLLAPRIQATRLALAEMAASSSIAQRGMAKTAVAAGKVGLALVGLQLAGSIVGSMLKSNLNPQVEAATKGLEEWNLQAKLSGESARLFGEDAEDLAVALTILGEGGVDKVANSVLNWGGVLTGIQGPLDDSREKVDALDASLAAMVRAGNSEQAIGILKVMSEKSGIAIKDLKDLLPQYAGAAEVAAKGTKAMGKAAEEAIPSYEELEVLMKGIIDTAFGFEEAQDKAADGVAGLAEAIKQQREAGEAGAGTLDRNTEAGRKNAEMVRGLVDDYVDLMIQAQKDGVAFNGMRQQLVDQLTALGIAPAEAARYTASLEELRKKLEQIQSKQISVKVDIEQRKVYGSGFTEFAHGGITGAAGGGPRGAQTWVGEHGPELVDLAPGSMVHSNPDSMRMASQGGGMQYVAQPFVYAGSNRIMAMVIDEISAEVQRRGGQLAVLGLKAS